MKTTFLLIAFTLITWAVLSFVASGPNNPLMLATGRWLGEHWGVVFVGGCVLGWLAGRRKRKPVERRGIWWEGEK